MFIPQAGIDDKDNRCMNWNECEGRPQYSISLSELNVSIVLEKTWFAKAYV